MSPRRSRIPERRRREIRRFEAPFLERSAQRVDNLIGDVPMALSDSRGRLFCQRCGPSHYADIAIYLPPAGTVCSACGQPVRDSERAPA